MPEKTVIQFPSFLTIVEQTSLFGLLFNLHGVKQHKTPEALNARLCEDTAVGKAAYLQGELELQQLCVAGSSVTEEFGIIWVPLNSLAVMFHG